MKTQTKRSTRRLAASIVITAALATVGAYAADWTVSENTTLTEDMTVDALTVNSGVTLDLAGYSLTVTDLAGSGTVTSTDVDLSSPDTEQTRVTWVTKFGTENATANGDVRTGNNVTQELPRNLFDDNTANTSRVLATTDNLPLAVIYDFGEGAERTIYKYKIYGESTNAKYVSRSPKDWTLEGSNDNSTWTEVHSNSDETWTNGQAKEFTVDEDKVASYRYYRIVITASSMTAGRTDAYLELNEIEYFGVGELHVNSAASVSSSLAITGKTKVVKEGNGTLSGFNQIAYGSGSSVELEVDGGSVTVASEILYVGYQGAGTLTINDGTVEVASSSANVNLAQQSGSSGAINLNGGTLKTRRVVRNTSGATATLNFNGGTLLANSVAPSNLGGGLVSPTVTTTVGTGGGTIDSGDYAVTVGAAIGGTGAMKFKGGNTITLEGANTYTGGTTIELGTKVVTSVADAKAAILDNGLTIDGSAYPSEAIGIVVFEYNGLTAADIENKITFVNCGTGTAASVSEGKLLVDFVAPSWALDANANWSDLVATYGTPAAGETVRIAASGAYTLTIDQNVAVGQIVFTGSNPNVVVNSGCTVTADTVNFSAANTDYYVLNNGVVVLNGTGTTSMRFNNDSRGVYYVNAGTLLSAAQPEQGSNATPELLPEGTNQFICVSSGVTYDINGKANNTASVRLAAGATVANGGTSSVGTGNKQIPQLILDGDATATITRSFGLVGTGNTETRLDLGANTLTITGGGNIYSFFLDNTTISGTGKIFVEAGHLAAYRKPHGDDWSLEIGSSGRLTVGNLPSDNTLTVGDFVNNGRDASAADGGALVVKGTLTPGNTIKKLTLANDSTVKATGTAQTVSTTFSASGTITIDASEITKEQLDAAVDQRIPVLTVPTASVPSGVTWDVSGPDARAKWVDNGDDTSTLYLAKPTGLMIIFR